MIDITVVTGILVVITTANMVLISEPSLNSHVNEPTLYYYLIPSKQDFHLTINIGLIKARLQSLISLGSSY